MSAFESPSCQALAEQDTIYIENARAVNRRRQQGKLTPAQADNLRRFQIESAMRRHTRSLTVTVGKRGAR